MLTHPDPACEAYRTLDESDCTCGPLSPATALDLLLTEHLGRAPRRSTAYLSPRDESGTALGTLVALLLWTITWVVLGMVLLVWFSPRADAVRVVPGSGAQTRDYCPNLSGVQSVYDLIDHKYRVKVQRHGPRAGEVVCKARRVKWGR